MEYTRVPVTTTVAATVDALIPGQYHLYELRVSQSSALKFPADTVFKGYVAADSRIQPTSIVCASMSKARDAQTRQPMRFDPNFDPKLHICNLQTTPV